MPATGSKPEADIHLIDETFDASHSESYHLSIQTEPGRLTFCVLNTVIHKYIALRSYPLTATGDEQTAGECASVFENDDMLGLHYKNSSHLWVSPRCTLVPESLFDAGEADACLAFNHGAKAGQLTQHNHIRAAGLYAVFSCPETYLSTLRQYQPDIRHYHQVTPLIDSFITGIPSSDKSLAIYFYSCYLDIAVARRNELLFYNTFHIHASEDAVYYLAGVSNLFDIDLSAKKVLHAGNFSKMPPGTGILKNYAGSITDGEPGGIATFSHYIQPSVVKNFIHLFNLYGCGL